MSFATLKKARKTGFSKLTEEIEKLSTTNKSNNGNGADDRFWKLTVDKAGKKNDGKAHALQKQQTEYGNTCHAKQCRRQPDRDIAAGKFVDDAADPIIQRWLLL